MIRIVESKDVGRILKRREARMNEAEETVRPILEAVRKRGDKAVFEYAKKFDGFGGRSVLVSAAELEAARKRLPPALWIASKAERPCPLCRFA